MVPVWLACLFLLSSLSDDEMVSDLYDRNREGLDWNRFDFPDAGEPEDEGP